VSDRFACDFAGFTEGSFVARPGVVAILTKFEKLTDPRMERTKRHRLLDMVAIALCAAICGADSWTDVEKFGVAKGEWFARFLELPNGIPSHDTFGRVFARLDTQEFMMCVQNWLRSLHLSLKEQGVAIDGKTLRGAVDAASGKSALHVVSAWACGLRLSLGQVAVDGKSNEITAVPKLLELLELAGAVVTMDAMHCQKGTLKAIRAKQADYLIAVKDNQPKLYSLLHEVFLDYGERDYKAPGLRSHRTVERNRGRDEIRICYVAPAPAALKTHPEWTDVKSVVMVYRECRRNGKETNEVAYFISSLPPRAKRIARYIRGHWGIENTLHWTLDVIFSEDKSRIRTGNGPEIASIFRKLALMVLQRDTTSNGSLRGKRLQAGWNEDFLERILCGFAGN
jgi:predicted transposase YbfD/YdcC